ncbi:hypothetical protein PENSTE_c001G01169 [Penicillium steckii]|uniref:Uncharacterized protein n=1 Tax=Penicillium steckii TaxID=303698 RepID=A0A1V6TYY8_9EURO|nr:hypothetical protein PENSTE_c001G01169 [Penicillium steckii]
MLTRSKTKENGEEFKDPDLYDQQADYGF